MLPIKRKQGLPSNNAIVVKSNKLLAACYDLSLKELQLVNWLVRVAQEDEDDYKYYEIDLPLFLQYMGLDGSNSARDRVRQVTANLQEKMIEIEAIERPGEWERFGWLRYAQVRREGPRLVLRLGINPEIRPYIKDLKSAFTKTNFYMLPEFTRPVAWRFYEWFKQFADTGWFIITIDELRRRLDIKDGEYQRFNNLRQRLIDPSIEQVNQVSDILVRLEKTEKRGRSVHKLHFRIEAKPQFVLPPDDASLDEAKLIIQRLVGHGMPEKEARKNVERFYAVDREHLLNALADLENKIENGFDFKEDNPLIWLRHLLKTDMRTQPSLFIQSGEAGTVDERSLAAVAHIERERRADHLEQVLENAFREYLKAWKRSVTSALANIPPETAESWRQDYVAMVSPAFRSYAENPDTFWHARVFQDDIDAFLTAHGQPAILQSDFYQSIAFDAVGIEAELRNLRPKTT